MQHLNLLNIHPSSYVHFMCVCTIHLLEKMPSLSNTSNTVLVTGDDKPADAQLLGLCLLLLLLICAAVVIILIVVCI